MSGKLNLPVNLILRSDDEITLPTSEPGLGRPVKYINGDTSIAVICQDGTLTACSSGETVIRAVTADGQETQIHVTVDRVIPHTTVSNTTLMFAGSICPGEETQRQLSDRSYDFTDIFSPEIRQILSHSDLNICVCDTACNDDEPFDCELNAADRIYPNSPATLLKAISSTGFNMVCTAGIPNSSPDIFKSLIADYGMNPIGCLGANPVIRKLGHVRIAFINMSTIFSDSNAASGIIDGAPSDNDFCFYSDSYAEEVISKAKAKDVDMIIVVMRWGITDNTVITHTQRSIAVNLAELGADLIIGTGSGTLQQYEEINTVSGRIVPCLYSLGYLYHPVSDNIENNTGAIAKVIISEDSQGYSCHLSLIPTVCTLRSGLNTVVPVSPVATSAQEKANSLVHSIYPDVMFNSSFGRSALLMGSHISEQIALQMRTPHIYGSLCDSTLESGLYDYLILDSFAFISDLSAGKNLLKKISRFYPSERIILIRLKLPEYKYTGHEIESQDMGTDLAKSLKAAEQMITDSLHPIIIDIADNFLSTADYPELEYELFFYINAARIIDSAISDSSHKLYYTGCGQDIWIDRIAAYRDTLKGNSYSKYFFKDGDAACRLIEATGSNFIHKYRNELLALRFAHTELPYVKYIIKPTDHNKELLDLADRLSQEH